MAKGEGGKGGAASAGASGDGGRRTELIIKRSLKAILASDPRAGVEVGDKRVPGLVIRVKPRGATWDLRGRVRGRKAASTWLVHRASEADDIEAVRLRATQAKHLMSRGVDPSNFLQSAREGRPWTWRDAIADAVKSVPPERRRQLEETSGDPKFGPTGPPPAPPVDWTWRAATGRFGAERGEAGKKDRTVDDIRQKLLGRHVPDALKDKRLADVTPDDLQGVSEELLKDKKRATAKQFVGHARRLLRWAATQKGSLTRGLASPVDGVAKVEYAAPRGYLPQPKELADLLWGLGDYNGHPSVRLAVALVVMTDQRSHSVLGARLRDFAPWPERPGWAVWTIPPGLVKTLNESTDTPHVVPLPPLAAAVVARAREVRQMPHSPYLFPATRVRRVGDDPDEVPTGPLSYKALRDAIAEATGYAAVLRAGGRAEGARRGRAGQRFTSHAVRRAQATHGKKILRVRADLWRLVQKHGELWGDVHGADYDFDDYIDEKAMALGPWCEWLVDLCAEHAPHGRAEKWPSCLPPPPSSAPAPAVPAPAARPEAAE